MWPHLAISVAAALAAISPVHAANDCLSQGRSLMSSASQWPKPTRRPRQLGQLLQQRQQGRLLELPGLHRWHAGITDVALRRLGHQRVRLVGLLLSPQSQPLPRPALASTRLRSLSSLGVPVMRTHTAVPTPARRLRRLPQPVPSLETAIPLQAPLPKTVPNFCERWFAQLVRAVKPALPYRASHRYETSNSHQIADILDRGWWLTQSI